MSAHIDPMQDEIDTLITGIVQHANAVSQTSEVDKPIMLWKSYPKMREAVEKLIEDKVEEARWHDNIGSL